MTSTLRRVSKAAPGSVRLCGPAFDSERHAVLFHAQSESVSRGVAKGAMLPPNIRTPPAAPAVVITWPIRGAGVCAATTEAIGLVRQSSRQKLGRARWLWLRNGGKAE